MRGERILLALLLATCATPALAKEDACATVGEVLSDKTAAATAAFVTDLDPESVEGDEIVGNLPPFCRISGTASPAEGSKIGFEIWLPEAGWNGRFRMFGNGGYSSSMAFDKAGAAVKNGYAVALTNTGHEGDDPIFAEGRPESVIDWAHRAVHETAIRGKAAVAAFYGKGPDYSYFNGCSTGGQQAFSQTQRYPEDFDGIIAGAPGHNRTHLNAGFLWLYLSNHKPGVDAEQIVPNQKMHTLASTVFKQCKAQRADNASGLASDPFLNEPLSCEPDLEALVCEKGENCFTQAEVDALAKMYDGVRDPETGARIYFGWPVGSEGAVVNEEKPGWSLYWADFGNPKQPARVSFWQIWGFDDPEWSWWDLDLSKDMTAVDDRIAETVNAMDADLSSFEQTGGKMIHYHGLADPVVPALDSIDYYERVQEKIGDTDDFYRLFLAPGMEHCRGGSGADTMDLQPLIEAWVEEGEAPDRIVAAHHASNDSVAEIAFTRPHCPYPQRAFYTGSGPMTEAASFECRDAAKPDYEAPGGYLR